MFISVSATSKIKYASSKNLNCINYIRSSEVFLKIVFRIYVDKFCHNFIEKDQ